MWKRCTLTHRFGSFYFHSEEIVNPGNGGRFLTKKSKETFELILISEFTG